jgi:GntR family transcriptional regulator
MQMSSIRYEILRDRAEPFLGFRPLYRQVRDTLVKRIACGTWLPGQALPSEPEIAADLGVSQGTVRKALDEMTAEGLVVRRQGRGTFVATHDEARILLHFFKLAPDSGEPRFPKASVLRRQTGPDAEASKRLGLSPKDPVLVIRRLRSLAGRACVSERICLPAALFPGLEERELPNNLYEFYSVEFGMTIGSASERLKAVLASDQEARDLDVAPGAPVLRIDRVAYSLDGRRTEWRVSHCRTDTMHYASDLR